MMQPDDHARIFVGVALSVVFGVFAICSLWIGAKAMSMPRHQRKNLYKHIPSALRRVYFWSIGILACVMILGVLIALLGMALE